MNAGGQAAGVSNGRPVGPMPSRVVFVSMQDDIRQALESLAAVGVRLDPSARWRIEPAARRSIQALARWCRANYASESLAPLFAKGCDRQAFLGAVALIEAGVLPSSPARADIHVLEHRINTADDAALNARDTWLHLIARIGEECDDLRLPGFPRRIGLRERCTWLARAGISLESPAGASPVRAAVESGNAAALEALVNAGATLESKPHGDALPLLHQAAQRGYAPVLRTLVRLGASTAVRASSGATALHTAALYDQAGAIDALCALGIEIEARCSDGMTALQVACAEGMADATRALMLRGADANRPCGKYALKPLACAVLGLKMQDDHSWRRVRYLDTIDALLEVAPSQVDMPIRNGFAALHIAAQSGDFELIELLLEHGACPDLQGPNSLTAEAIARSFNHERAASLLHQRSGFASSRDGDER